MPKEKQVDPFARLRTALRERRRALDLTTVDVADATKLGVSKIRKLEDDPGTSPRLVHVARLAAYYGLSGDEVFALLDMPTGSVGYHSTADGYDTSDIELAG